MNLVVNGALGYMGREVVGLCECGYRGARLAFGVDRDGLGCENIYPSFSSAPTPDGVDCIIDFSHHTALAELLDFALRYSIPTVIATTGHTEAERTMILNASRHIPIFFSANMALGVALLVELARWCALALPEAEIEIIEKHHSRKADAPSGTALMIANAIRDVRPDTAVKNGRSGIARRTQSEIGIHAVRMGALIGEHEVLIATKNQTITLKHEAHSRTLFAEGAIAAAEFTVGCECGLYDMKSLVSGEREREEQRI